MFYNNWPVSFNNVNVIKDNERLGNCSRVKETKEMWGGNAMHDPGFSLARKIIIETASKI